VVVGVDVAVAVAAAVDWAVAVGAALVPVVVLDAGTVVAVAGARFTTSGVLTASSAGATVPAKYAVPATTAAAVSPEITSLIPW
jgi:hypothetical protein